ncbi:zinc-dependent alcohol dehydrogenase family protein [Spelaeicoccus albus]|uniref:NADPH2:quinone reductase n=1 Tax=Spelaeicoccus albus TaxID=1280376 RepID=A0A7Z0A7I7_9MICO|nr:zinc-dependent alcohol dehydrogenase family protein [Spelaeicoccus albus]NYI65884.1 NADPH2:quinone reductase [Spelaeicoccus albus]
MRAAQIPTPGEITISDVPDPKPLPHEVVVEVARTGICGTDIHILAGEFAPTPYPIIPGHEFSGTVVARGSEVPADLADGTRVAVDPSLYCGHCAYCRAGRGNLCENWNAVGDTVDGAFAQYVSVPADNCYVMPDGMSFAQGAFVEPVSCAVHGVRRLGVEAGERILILGAGSMGLVLTQLLNAAGAQVTVVDMVADKLTTAEKLGAVETATSTSGLSRLGFDAAVDVTGAVPAVHDAFDALGRGGRLQIFGVAPAESRIELSPFRIYNDEITIVGTMAVLNSFAPALDLVARRVVDADAILSHTFGLGEFAEAIDMVKSGGSLKVQIDTRQ